MWYWNSVIFVIKRIYIISFIIIIIIIIFKEDIFFTFVMKAANERHEKLQE